MCASLSTFQTGISGILLPEKALNEVITNNQIITNVNELVLKKGINGGKEDKCFSR